ncbi:SusD/RagB family nutrient-binding outer membrane lipoprotein [Pontibacter pamirensis]|uniref:SusD/RagB family nutrient-binding outer membrane lipoprotein n=1 Tax=Pontibacter pamirensis TaxID=2562824 RepID=UPI001389D7D2|nr:SusD/RagB family nutrient-binding outer membrane lipoprotein [Pontibacter pamirensis]
MKKYRFLHFLLAVGLVLGSAACDEDTLDEIDTNPNSPEDVSVSLLMPQVTMAVPTAVTGVDLAWYSSAFVQHTAGVHGQIQDADRRSGLEDATLLNNVWSTIYATVLPDLDAIIRKGSEGGDEAGNWTHVGIAKVLKAYTLSTATDAWGPVPASEAGQGIENRQPTFDAQQEVYNQIQTLLDEAIADLDKEAATNPGAQDFIYGGDASLWMKAAYSLKARYWMRLSNVNSAAAQNALDAAEQGFESAADNFTFNQYVASAIGEHPWFQELNDRSHHAVSESFVETLLELNDPRLEAMVAIVPDSGRIIGAPNATQDNDQRSVLFSDVTTMVLNPTSPMPMMTYDELQFIMAEAYLRLGNTDEAYDAYQEGIRAAMLRQLDPNPSEEVISEYLSNPALPQSAGALTLENIIRQKWIAFFYFQPFEAYNDWRRTGFPAFIDDHLISPPPVRFPYPQDEIDANEAQVPDIRGNQIFTNPIWWMDGEEEV